MQYSAGTIGLVLLIALGFWLYFQMGQQEEGHASSGANPPANDTKAQAAWLTDLYEDHSSNAEFTNSHATSDAISGGCFANGAQNGVWFKFQALYDEATITVKTGGNNGTLQNAEIALFDNNDNEIACATGTGSSNVTIDPTSLSQDDWYYVLVDSETPSDTGSFTIYINNVSPTKYYTIDKGNWNDNSNWSTSGHNGSPAGSVPGKANVVFVDNLNGSLDINGYLAECAGVVMTATNKHSELKMAGNGELKVHGKLHLDGIGNKQFDLSIDDASLYVQDELLAEKKSGNQAMTINFKEGNVNMERSFEMKHTGGKGFDITFENNTTLNIGEDFLVNRMGGTYGLDLLIMESDVTVGGMARVDYNSGLGAVNFECKDNGTFTVAGNFELQQQSGMDNFEFLVQNNFDLTVNGHFIALENGTNDKLDIEFNNNGNLTLEGDFRFGANNGSTNNYLVDVKVLGSVWDIAGDMEMLTSKGKLEFDNTATLTLSGDTPQYIIGESDNQQFVEYQNITINNTYTDPQDTAAAVILQGPVTVEETLELINGIVRSTNSNLLTFGLNSNVTGASSSSFVYGPVNKVGSSDFEFPVGSAGVFAPLEIRNYSNGSSNNEFQVQHFHAGHPDTATGNNISHISTIEYWKVEEINASGSLQAEIVLNWIDGNLSGITELPDLTIAGYDGSVWSTLEPTSATGSVSAGSISTDNGQNSFGLFTFASMGGGNILPIELTTFEASLQENNTVLLNWETEMEVNNDFFTLEKSSDGQRFEAIGTVQGAGNSDGPRQYRFVDEQPAAGSNYYRLKQTDFDGKFEYFPVEEVKLSEEPSGGTIEITDVYPVPFTDQITVRIDCDGSTDANIVLVNMSGSQFPLSSVSLTAGSNTVSSEDLGHLPKGTYILTIITPEKTYTKKIMKAR